MRPSLNYWAIYSGGMYDEFFLTTKLIVGQETPGVQLRAISSVQTCLRGHIGRYSLSG